MHSAGPHARQAGQVDLRHRPRRHRHAASGGEAPGGGGLRPRSGRPRGVRAPGLAMARGVRRHHPAPVPRARCLTRLLRRALHHGRGLRAGGRPRVRPPTREGSDLPRQLHGQLGPGPAHGHLGPRGRAADGGGHALPGGLPARVGLRLGDRRHRAPGDDARRHGHRSEPGRRALFAAHRRDRDPAARGPAAADHRRRPRGPGVRHGRAQDHAGPRPGGLRHRARPRPRRGHGDRRGRAHHRFGAGALPRHGDRRGAGRGGGRAASREPRLGDPALRARRAPLASLGTSHRAADLAPVVLRHEPAGTARHGGGEGRPDPVPPREQGERLPRTGWSESVPGASRDSSGGATSYPSGTAATRPTWARRPRRARAGSATPTCSTPGSRRVCGRSRPSAGRATRRSCARSIPPTSSPRRATSSSSGWPGW